MAAWNEFIPAATLLNDASRFTLPAALQRYVGEYKTEWGHFAAGALIISAPVMALVNYRPDDGVRLGLQAPMALSPVVTLGRGGHVTWASSLGDRIVVTTPPLSRLEGNRQKTTAIRCEDTSIAQLMPIFPADAPDGGTARYLDLPAGTRAPVSLVAGGPPVETLAADAEVRSVRVLAEEGDWARIRVSLGEARVEGWMARSLLKDKEPAAGFSNVLGAGGLGMRGSEGNGRPNHVRCASEVLLLLRMDGQVSPLGTLRKNAAVREVSRAGGVVEVSLPELDWLTLEAGAAYELTEQAAAECGLVPTPGG